MLFKSFEFIFVFLPVTLGGWFLFGRFGKMPAIWWLLFASLAFYARWNPYYLLLLVPYALMNFYVASQRLAQLRREMRGWCPRCAGARRSDGRWRSSKLTSPVLWLA